MDVSWEMPFMVVTISRTSRALLSAYRHGIMHHQKLLKTDLTEDERDYIKTAISPTG